MPHVGQPAYLPGRTVLEKYELVSVLAEGGMGVVWLARHLVLQVDVAVKLTPSGGAVSETARQRALSEARLAAQLAHPAVCRVLDFGLTEEGDPCVVTELLRGETLDRTLLVEGQLRPIESVQILLPVLDALAAAHEQGIVHQDVKPSNIFLARDARGSVQPKLLDFGIARAQSEPASWQVSGTVSGTPCYMSPEQATASADVDHRTDLWSACATLYELLSGVPPFEGESCVTMLTQVIRAEPRPLSAFHVLDAELADIVGRGLQKNPDSRWQSASELAHALACWLLAQGVDVDISGHTLRGRPGVSEGTPRDLARPSFIQTLVALPVGETLRRNARELAERVASAGSERVAAVSLVAVLLVAASGSLLTARSPAPEADALGAVVLARAATPAVVVAPSVASAEPIATSSPALPRTESRAESPSAPSRSLRPERSKAAATRPGKAPPARRDGLERNERTARPRANELDYDFGF